jgi:hypothetical protein
MRCTRVEKFLPLHVAGDLAGRRAERRVANHLTTCERCRGLTEEYEASRKLVRAATLPPDFDGAFYESIRRSVLAEIERGRTTRHAPPPFAGFTALRGARFAYAASLALAVVAVAALSLHSYVGQKSKDGARTQNLLADVKGERRARPATMATPISTQARGDERQTRSPVHEVRRETASRESQVAASPRRRAYEGNSQTGAVRSSYTTKHTPSHARRNPLTPIVAATAEHAEEIASGGAGSETNAAPKVSRIEIQTSDPNIRIIWLSPKPDGVAQPLK